MVEFNILDAFILESNSKLLLYDENLYAFVHGPTHFSGDDNCSKPPLQEVQLILFFLQKHCKGHIQQDTLIFHVHQFTVNE